MALTVDNFVGFETQGMEEAASTLTTPEISTTIFHSGAASLLLNDTLDEYVIPWLSRGGVGGPGPFIFGFAIYLDGFPSINDTIVEAKDNGASRVFHMAITTTGILSIHEADGDTIDTAAEALNTDQWHYLEFYVDLGATSGDWEWWIDGNSEGSGTANFDDGGTFGGLTSALHLLGVDNDVYYDDVYMLSDAAATDRYGDCEVFKYQSVKNSDVPDDSGDTLNAGTWNRAGETPLASTATHPEYTNTGAGAVNTDATNGFPEGPKNDARIDGDSNIKAMKVISNMQRSGGGGSQHFMLFGNDADGTLRSNDIAPTASFDNYEYMSELATVVPLSSEYCQIGFETTGAQDYECQEQWGMLLHVPDPPTDVIDVPLVMAPYMPA